MKASSYMTEWSLLIEDLIKKSVNIILSKRCKVLNDKYLNVKINFYH